MRRANLGTLRAARARCTSSLPARVDEGGRVVSPGDDGAAIQAAAAPREAIVELPDGLSRAIAAWLCRTTSADGAQRTPSGKQLRVEASQLLSTLRHRSRGLPLPGAEEEPADPAPQYTTPEVDAYAASRLPCTYAALKYAFKQLAVRAPSFAPRSMLDFGSGPGTASWAAASLWPGACTHLMGVEPSPGMRALADALQASCAAPVDPGAAVPPPCRHVAALERLRGPEQQRRYDLVVAAYALGELPSRAAQQAAVRRLWAHTRDVLVIVEPGTPKAAALVRAARQDVLDIAARAGRTRAKAAQRSLAASIDAIPGGGDGEGEDPSVHVVAPCAHERRCPMEDSSSWCHFVQRVQRTAAQRLSKGGANIWSHQDERFSYAILRRGPRPQAAPRLLAPPGSAPEHADAGSTAMAEASALAAAGWPRVVRPPRRRTRHVVLDLCTPAGELEQRTVAASHHAALGEGSTELLRGLRWGDCWPHPPAK